LRSWARARWEAIAVSVVSLVPAMSSAEISLWQAVKNRPALAVRISGDELQISPVVNENGTLTRLREREGSATPDLR
jgi:hypothetical protein